MGQTIKIIFSSLPQTGDFVRLNSDFAGEDIVETFVASRSNAKEVTIGNTIEETVNNFETGFNTDYSGLFSYNIVKTENSISISFAGAGVIISGEETNSEAIILRLAGNYFTYFKSEYTNNVRDNFKLFIKGKNINIPEQNISAYADLSYKDVDGILEPIRGAQLDININASIERPFDLFLDFKEKDFLAELYRNDDLIFQGFINPEGVTQSFTSKYWVSQLTAVDNLAALKNTELKYDNELPSEHVLLDKCLKETGLDLPIAFFDDINFRRKDNSVSYFYGKSIWRGEKERIVDPFVFRNDNGRFVSCNKVLQDILNKYNAVLIQQSITHEGGTDLCWVFFRPSLFEKTWDYVTNKQFPVVKITGYNTETNFKGYASIDVPIIEELGRANPKTLKLGTKDTKFINAYYKNSNQLIRQSRALQNFRFKQDWILRDTIFQYRIGNFDIIRPKYVFVKNDRFTFRRVDQESGFLGAVEAKTIFLNNEAQRVNISGRGVLKLIENNSGFSGPLRISERFQLLHTSLDGSKYILSGLTDEQGRPNGNEWIDFFPGVETTSVYLWQIEGRVPEIVDIDFTVELPPLSKEGGQFQLFINSIDTFGSAFLIKYNFELDDFKVTEIPPARLGKGEFHDALNLQPISTKLDDPIEVINADESTNFFRNGLKFLPSTNESPENYDLWTTEYDQEGATRLLEIMSKERIRLFAKSQNIFSGDIGNYMPYFCRIQNQAYSNIFFTFTKYIYRTAENTIEAELREVGVRNPSVKYENSIIFEDEENRLIE